MVETYKKIEGFENYSVSDLGNVREDIYGKIQKLKLIKMVIKKSNW